MGYRTLVLLHNDNSDQWKNDPQLGRKISAASNFAMTSQKSDEASLGYGRVVECCHADQQTLAVVDSYSLHPLAHSHWFPNQTDEERALKLLKEAADKLGYRLVRKSGT